ncbi:MAG: AAA family ATPase, partial [Lachnospiraceae bacterium]|nr:AAA family ATPase [Lachnospiraceae bacterium]
MKIISCHIGNFGKLQDRDFGFREGCAVIHKENGWGKSTLATFIRVMFYGFLGENKRSEIENERKKFRPWQMGTYGGSLVFEAGGKRYRIERSFGEKKASDDLFELYDDRTNLKSSDFSENIGEELFGIDIDSFMRTVFIAQQDCGTGVTAGINAKIGNVSDQTADMGLYDEVHERLKKETDRLTPDRKTGDLY